MFIVAVTLGLLAVMGVYGLAATTADVRSAGHMREALQGQKAAEHAMMMTAETFNPSVASGLYNQMTAPVVAGVATGHATNCKTAAAYTGFADRRAAEACKRLDPAQMQALGQAVTGTAWAAPFTALSFGKVQTTANPIIEVTNPIDIASPGNSEEKYAQLTVTVFTQMKPPGATAAETVVTGRGRITVGPIKAMATNYAP